MSRTQHIADFIEDRARTDSGYAIAYAILQLVDAQKKAAAALNLDFAGERLDVGLGAIADAIRTADG